MPPIMFKLNQMSYHGGHLGHQNQTILAILNLHAAPIPPLSFCSIRLTVREQITTEDFQDGRRRCCLKIFKMADMAAILDIGME